MMPAKLPDVDKPFSDPRMQFPATKWNSKFPGIGIRLHFFRGFLPSVIQRPYSIEITTQL